MAETETSEYGRAKDAASRLVTLIEALVAESHPARKFNVTLDSSLERDLGLDSLARVELLLRVGREFGVHLPNRVLANAETARDLLREIASAQPAEERYSESEIHALAPGGSLDAPSNAATLNEVLQWHVARDPGRLHACIYDDEDREVRTTYGELAQRSRIVAAHLLARGLEPGQSVAIMLPTGAEYFHAFLGILLAGAIPVPIYPPVRLSQIEDHMRRHAAILSNAGVAMLITVPAAHAVAQLLRTQVSSLRDIIAIGELATGNELGAGAPACKAGDIAFLQYTSGSTGNPKGVTLTHANLLANIRAMGSVIKVDASDVFISWLPLYHDMGLIGAWLGSLYYGMPLAIMSPLAFLSQPQRWLWAIHRHRGTLSAAPNFAYELCTRKVDDAQLKGLDLSSWRYAFNGAEPVSPATVRAFQQRFEKYGLRRNAMAPVYGLAESSVGLALQAPGRGAPIDRVVRQRFLGTGEAVPAPTDAADALEFVGCGIPLPDHHVRVINAAGIELGERREGRLEFKGPSSTSGYYRNPDETRKLFDGEWLDSGDRAYIADGQIYLTGRVKDIIIRGGRNIYPYELEHAVGDIPGVRRGCVAVFASTDADSGTERLVVLAETRETDAQARAQLRAAIGACALDVLGMPADDIVLAPPHTVLKTSSGKIRRAASREFYERGGGKPPPVWWQFTRLAGAGALAQLSRVLRGFRDYAYAIWTWFCFAVLAPLVWAIVSVIGSPRAARPIVHYAARLFVWVTRIPLAVEGLNLLPRTPCVMAVNHSSYVDGILLCAALPTDFKHAFVAKGEFRDHFVPRLYLRGMGAVLVERFDPVRGAEDAELATQALSAGASPVFFPEGTFDRRPGLLPFRNGAFSVAARAGVVVTPVTIRGSRNVLRGNDWFPYRHPVRITVGTPIAPQGADWSNIVRLRDQVRARILATCGEPDLGG